MRATFRLSSQLRVPSIKFLGKRTVPAQPDTPHPHPQAPPEFQRVFTSSSSTSPSSNAAASAEANSEEPTVRTYAQYWEAPPRYWNYRAHALSKDEINAIMSGGASAA